MVTLSSLQMLHVSTLSELVGLYMFQDKNQMVILEATIGLLWKVQTKTAKKKDYFTNNLYFL